MPFTGRAIYDSGIFDGVAEDVSPIVSIISPFETPLLDALGDAPYPAKNILHEWLEDALQPDTITTSCAVASTGADTAFGVVGGYAKYLRVGTLLQVGEAYNAELMQVSVIAGNTITVTRAFGGTSASSIGAGGTLKVIADSALDGSDVTTDNSRPRPRKGNICQLFKEDIIIAGSLLAVTQLGGINDELEYQKQIKLRTVLKNLEKNVIRSRTSGTTLGSSTAYRTMSGLLQMIATNVASIGTMSDDLLAGAIKLAWDNGGSDIDLVCADAAFKRQIDSLASTRIRQLPDEQTLRTLVSYYESSFGTQKIIMSRWMPNKTFFGLATARVKVVPLQKRSFNYEPIAKTGDSEKGMVVGDYTLEVKNEEGLVFAHG